MRRAGAAVDAGSACRSKSEDPSQGTAGSGREWPVAASAPDVADRAGPLEWPKRRPLCMAPMRPPAAVSRPSSPIQWECLKQETFCKELQVRGCGEPREAKEALSINGEGGRRWDGSRAFGADQPINPRPLPANVVDWADCPCRARHARLPHETGALHAPTADHIKSISAPRLRDQTTGRCSMFRCALESPSISRFFGSTLGASLALASSPGKS